MITVNKTLCTSCGSCARICPFTVLEMNGGIPAPKERKEKACIKCFHCVAICPTRALSFDEVPELNLPSAQPSPDSYDHVKRLICGNRSIRHFSDVNVPLADIEDILAVAGYAPSAKNQHPTRWILVHDTAMVRNIRSMVHDYVEQNSISREILSEYKSGNDIVTLSAPHLLYGVASKDAVNPYTDTIIALTDVGLLFHASGIGSCWAGYLNRLTNADPVIRQLIGLEDSEQVFGVLAFGYPKGERYDRLPYRKAGELTIL